MSPGVWGPRAHGFPVSPAVGAKGTHLTLCLAAYPAPIWPGGTCGRSKTRTQAGLMSQLLPPSSCSSRKLLPTSACFLGGHNSLSQFSQ